MDGDLQGIPAFLAYWDLAKPRLEFKAGDLITLPGFALPLKVSMAIYSTSEARPGGGELAIVQSATLFVQSLWHENNLS